MIENHQSVQINRFANIHSLQAEDRREASYEGSKVCIKYAAALNGFGPDASPPMQPFLGHSALKLCEIGESRHHVGR